MSFENAAKLEQMLESLGSELHGHFTRKDYAAAKKTFQTMKAMTNGCKLRLLGVMLKMSPGAAGMAGRDMMEFKAQKCIEVVLRDEATTSRAAVLARVFGRGAGALGLALLVKDLMDGGFALADAAGERMALSRMAQYGDYLAEYENSTQSASVLTAFTGPQAPKTYQQWLTSDYLPGQQQKNSEFWQNMK